MKTDFLSILDTVSCNPETFKIFLRRLSEQIMAQYRKSLMVCFFLFLTDECELFLFVFIVVYERINKLHMWWWMNKRFSVIDKYSVQKLLDVFFG